MNQEVERIDKAGFHHGAGFKAKLGMKTFKPKQSLWRVARSAAIAATDWFGYNLQGPFPDTLPSIFARAQLSRMRLQKHGLAESILGVVMNG